MPREDGGGARGAEDTGEAKAEPGARVVGVAVAACALLVLGLGSVAFMALPDDDAPGPHAAAVGDGTVPQLAEGGSAEPTGSPSGSASASASASGSGRPAPGKKGTRPGAAESTDSAGKPSPGSDTAHPDTASGTEANPPASGGGTATRKPASGRSTSATAAAQVAAAGDTIVGYGSSKCVEVSDHNGSDGSPLRLWGCDGDAWQKWVFKSDGSVRSMGLCLDIAHTSQANGAAVQVATCNGGWAQRFELNGSNDLVNTVIGKCVDAADQGTGNGTRLQLWDCNGASNQKWYRD
ncbi:RICIN domain-containing protein [Streptomyces ziwulingensis]|uniref:RICIN domain-containing protein n=1 Tax=Streptomyces ziwulingensis TaxID=1045501 RepID=UPI0031E9CC66